MRTISLTLAWQGGKARAREEKTAAKPDHGAGYKEGFSKIFNKKNRIRGMVSRDLNTWS
jgi:hypothetical protein